MTLVSKAQPAEVWDRLVQNALQRAFSESVFIASCFFSIKSNKYPCADTTDTVTSWFLIVHKLKAKLCMALPYITWTSLI